MYYVELYARVRRACMVEGMSVREASRVFGLHRDTVRKMLAYSVPPGYRRQDPPRRPKLSPFTGVIDAILETDRQVPRKQRHTAKRIFERLRDEYGFEGGYTTVKDYVQERRRQTQDAASEPDTGDYGVILLTGRSDSVFLDELTAVVEGFPCLGKERCECLPDVGHVVPDFQGNVHAGLLGPVG